MLGRVRLRLHSRPARNDGHVCHAHRAKNHIQPAFWTLRSVQVVSSYCFRSRRLANRALITRILSPLSVCTTTSNFPWWDRPSTIDRSSSCEWAGSGIVSERASPNTVAASSKLTPCLARLVLALFWFHSKLSGMAQACRMFERKPSRNLSTRFSLNTLGNLIHCTRVKPGRRRFFNGFEDFRDYLGPANLCGIARRGLCC